MLFRSTFSVKNLEGKGRQEVTISEVMPRMQHADRTVRKDGFKALYATLGRPEVEHGVRFIPHGWNTAVGLAADLQLTSAFPGTDLIEYLTGSPFIDEITAGGWHLDADGMLAIPTKPGLGLTLDPDAVKKYTRGERLLE